MQLIYAAASPFARKVRVLAAETGLLDRIELLDTAVLPTTLNERVNALNPLGKIPVLLSDDGEALYDSRVICEYLEDQFPTPSLRAENPAKRALVRTINRINDLYILAPMFDLAPHVEMQSRDQAVVEQKFEELVLGLVRLNHFIEGPDYAVGNTLTLADCALVPTLYVMTRYLPSFDRADQLKKHPKISSYWERIQHNPRAVPIIDDLAAAMRDRL